MKEEGATYLAFAQVDELGGRYSGALGPTHLVGATAAPVVAGGQRDAVGPEPPLGYRIDDLPELEPPIFSPVEAQASPEPCASSEVRGTPTPGSTVAPSAFDVERRDVGLGLSRPWRRF